DKYASVGVHKYSVWPGESALQGITIRPITAFSCPRDQLNRSFMNVDHPDAVTFRVGEVNITARRDADPFGTLKRCQLGRPAIAAEALFSRAGHVVDSAGHVPLLGGARAGFRIHLVDRVAFAQREPHPAVLV